MWCPLGISPALTTSHTRQVLEAGRNGGITATTLAAKVARSRDCRLRADTLEHWLVDERLATVDRQGRLHATARGVELGHGLEQIGDSWTTRAQICAVGPTGASPC
jgi:hypothetical protein